LIIKCLTSKTPRYFQILEYLNKNEGKIYNNQNQSFVYKQHLYGLTNKQISREFMNNEKNRIYQKSNNIKFSQEILAFSDLDHEKLSISIIEDLTKEYIRQRSPYMQSYAIGHFNNNSYHVHIISSPIEIGTGLNLRMTKERFTELKIYMQQYQQERYPELSQSLVRHGLGIDKEVGITKPKFKQSNKDYIKALIHQSLSKANHSSHFYDLLKEAGVLTYQRGEISKGVVYEGKKYRFKTLIPDFSNQLEQLNTKEVKLSELKELRSIREDDLNREIEDMRGRELFDREVE
jgi:hypothetical protein